MKTRTYTIAYLGGPMDGVVQSLTMTAVRQNLYTLSRYEDRGDKMTLHRYEFAGMTSDRLAYRHRGTVEK